jgi:hypothetical protein
MGQTIRPMHNEAAASVSAGVAYPTTPIELPKGISKIRIRVTPVGASTVTLTEGADAVAKDSILEKPDGNVTVGAGRLVQFECAILGGSEVDREVRLKFSATTTVNIIIEGIVEDQ